MARPFRLTRAHAADASAHEDRPHGSRRARRTLEVVGLAALFCVAAAVAQPPGGGAFGGGPAAPAARTPREIAPVDVTGYWVSLVTEDWIERMSPDSPPSGDGGAFGFAARGGGPAGAPAPASNPDDRCRVYGAGGSLRVPGRLHITWDDDETLRIEMSEGSQTRLLHFGPAPADLGPPSLQGYSAASWDLGNASRAGFGGPSRGQWADDPASASTRRWGSLDVVTTNMTGGYLLSTRANYGPQAVLTEYFTHHEAFGRTYLTVTAIVEDGGVRRTTSSTFLKEPDGSKFVKTGCEVYR